MDDHEAYDHYGAWETEHIEVLSPVVGAPQGRSVLDLTQLPQNRISDIEDDTDDDDLHALLLPTDDPLLNNSFDDIPPSPTGSSDPYTSGSDGEHSSEDYDTKDDDTNDISFSNDSRFIDSGWGGECLRETEDIDFEFVYALHTFVATVEGQANATKGDTMVLLDDSNSYWWLVRIVKDSSIGYLPAEHIETPTERLARLNKHRNIDLSATMLGDNPEKSKNPLKKAIRRRHAKTVQFTAPTYVEASDYEYSSDEEEAINGEPGVNGAARPADASQNQGIDAENATVAEQADAARTMNGVGPEGEDRPGSGLEAGDEAVVNKHDHLEGISDVQPEGAALKSRNGMLRNTDSFFKDDTVETRKITLTPNLLRDDSSASTTRSSDAKERSSSLDSLEKSTSPPDKYKDDKRRKEKKPGMLSGLFKSKKKDKKGKLIDDDTTEAEKVTGETSSRGSPLLGRSGETSPVDRPATSVLPQGQQPPHRQTSKSKLQKTPPDIKISPRDRAADVASDAMSPTLQSPVVEKQSAAIAAVATIEGQDAGVSAPQRAPPMKPALRLRSPTEPQHVVTNLERPEGQSRKEHNGPLSPLTNMLRSDREPRPEKVKKAKQRVQLDDFDSPQDGDKSADPFADPNEAYDPLYQDDESHAPAAKELSESPFEILSPVSPLTEAEANSIPALVRDTSSHSDQDDELVSPSSTPSLLEADAASATTTTTTTAPTTPHATVEPPHTAQSPLPSTRIETPTHPSPRPSSASPTSLRTPLHLTPTPTWSDTRLRAFLDGDNDIRDMLLLVHDRSGAVPVGADHPLAKGLFGAERERLAEMEGVLDRLLEGVLDRGRGRGAVGT
ncbi:hypothetical protein B0A49_01770 [Cryomyces minteri]|uniref:SH3 domain-containing protein n=1 Tax=Cryomyces minteri TaxID=331657 RepID=A0A4U0XWF4_9PEZI|nr:hypothetical protein B0A49_01770 [Cryomyces minteri]